MQGWLWILVIAIPGFIFGSKSKHYQILADKHRRPDAPPLKPYWEPNDVFRPGLYTEKGNIYRKKAMMYYLPVPMAWIAFVLLLGHLINWICRGCLG
jgi:hypothetical protein